MSYFLTAIHILVCLFLVIVVLLQSGKAADLAGAFGGMGSQTAFGPRGSATVLSKATTIMAAMFMITSLSLAIIATRGGTGGTTVLETEAGAPTEQVPVAPSAPSGEQPSVTLTPEGGGESVTIPLDVPERPEGQPPASGQQEPAPNN